MLIILKALYFFLPAYIANMMPVFVRKIKFLDKPIHKKKLGKNKTWRGLLAGVLAGGLVFCIQRRAHMMGFETLSIVDYADFTPLVLGLLMGLGAVLGDLVESYYKRKNKIKPGKPWLFWDQIDFVLGGLVLSLFVYVPPVEVAVIILVASPLLHLLVNYIGYLLGIRKTKF